MWLLTRGVELGGAGGDRSPHRWPPLPYLNSVQTMSRETQKVDLDELTGGGSLGSPGGGGGSNNVQRPTPPPTDETQVMKEQKNFKSEMPSNRRIYKP